MIEQRYRLFWTSDINKEWCREDSLTEGTLTGADFEELMQKVRLVEPYAPTGQFGPKYDWRLELA